MHMRKLLSCSIPQMYTSLLVARLGRNRSRLKIQPHPPLLDVGTNELHQVRQSKARQELESAMHDVPVVFQPATALWRERGVKCAPMKVAFAEKAHERENSEARTSQIRSSHP